MEEQWEPWLWYPDIWPTKAKFFTWLRGCLRSAVWNRSPIKITTKNSLCSKPPEGYTGKAKSGAYCTLSGVWQGKSVLEVDHITGNVSLQNEGDILEFIKHLIPPPNSLQLVSKEAHKIKSFSEKQGITYEEAVKQKQIISILNQKKEKEVITAYGLVPAPSQKARRGQLEKLFSEKQVWDNFFKGEKVF